MKKLLIIMMIISFIHLFDVQANTTVLSQSPEAIQRRLYDRLNNLEAANVDTKITTSDGAAFDFLGTSIAIDGTTLVVGAHTDDDNNESNSGSVYVYDLTKISGDDGFETKITASDGAAGDFFGWSVEIDGTTLVVGAYGDDDNGSSSGSVYVYDLSKTSGDDGFQTKITPSDGAAGDLFGQSVTIDGTTLVVGAYQDDDNGSNSGSV
ncbi:MAG: FG-GAP repeat protein, partial [Acholeplasmataceae bacterium]